MTEEQAAKIEKETRGQINNPRWKDERQWRLTASRFGEICRSTPARDFDKLAEEIYNPPNIDHVPAICHGRIYEQTAIDAFMAKFHRPPMAKTEKEVKGCGIFIDPRFPYLGASPDGTITGENAIIEVKCPYTGRNEKIKPGNNFDFLEMKEGGDPEKFQLKRTHKYYYQVTAEMLFAKRNKCYFVVYTLAPDLFIEEISLDEEFFSSIRFRFGGVDLEYSTNWGSKTFGTSGRPTQYI